MDESISQETHNTTCAARLGPAVWQTAKNQPLVPYRTIVCCTTSSSVFRSRIGRLYAWQRDGRWSLSVRQYARAGEVQPCIKDSGDLDKPRRYSTVLAQTVGWSVP